MGFELAEIIAELGKSIAVGSELKGEEDGLMDLPGAPAPELGTAVQQDFHQTKHAGVMES